MGRIRHRGTRGLEDHLGVYRVSARALFGFCEGAKYRRCALAALALLRSR